MLSRAFQMCVILFDPKMIFFINFSEMKSLNTVHFQCENTRFSAEALNWKSFRKYL